ncbi:uncharacterized protein LOC130645538 [Hydractinia symbiolongicarpus]|uniref:uncharacterized protein LOC130645538 n=1 Tax=Hydractinia symbiolongicarpus TaxID=13093 RepID=UPI00254BAFF6|nr:uncharacterized protein LOC130645538 [Hydractinia symbiolongicarpus]
MDLKFLLVVALSILLVSVYAAPLNKKKKKTSTATLSMSSIATTTPLKTTPTTTTTTTKITMTKKIDPCDYQCGENAKKRIVCGSNGKTYNMCELLTESCKHNWTIKMQTSGPC